MYFLTLIPNHPTWPHGISLNAPLARYRQNLSLPRTMDSSCITSQSLVSLSRCDPHRRFITFSKYVDAAGLQCMTSDPHFDVSLFSLKQEAKLSGRSAKYSITTLTRQFQEQQRHLIQFHDVTPSQLTWRGPASGAFCRSSVVMRSIIVCAARPSGKSRYNNTI